MDERSEDEAGPWRIVVVVFVVAALVPLGVKAWDTGHDVAFAVLIAAVAVVFAGERVAVAIRERR